jgi:HlyD family secretion protein
MTKKITIALSVLVGVSLTVILVLYFTVGGGKAQAVSEDTAATASALRVETVSPVRQDIRRVSETTPAILLPYEQTDLYARLTGYVSEIRVDYGSRVKKGEVLAVLSVPEVEKELEQRQAQVTRAEAAIKQAQEAVKVAEAAVSTAEAIVAEAKTGRTKAQAEYERWKSEYTRMEDLVRRKVIDQQNLDETLNQLKASESGVAEAKAKIESAQAALRESKAKWDKSRVDVSFAEASRLVANADRGQAKAMLKYAKIVAPYDGVVTKRTLHTGAFINQKAADQPIFTVVRTDLLRVVVDVAERDVRYLDKDDKVAADFDGLPGKRFEWKITRLAPVLGAGKRVRVEVEIPNPDGTFYPGMYGRATVILEEKRQALTVPAACLGRNEQGTFVWLAMGGKAERRRVTVGIRDGDRAEITSGLSGTEEVICSGKDALRDGQPVIVQQTAMPAKK